MNRYVYAIVKRIRGLITIDFINGGLPLTYEGLFEDGMWYFADTTGTKVVDQNDPDRSEWFVGTGNADGDIDLDIKMLAITDVVIPETVQLGVAFDVSGNYVMLEPRIVIEAFDGVTWKKIHAGDYIEVADGSFTESVTIESADGFTVNSSVTIRVRSYDGYALNVIDSTDVIATVTMNAITGMVDGTLYTLEGTTDSDAVEIWVDDGTGYAKEGDAVVVGSAWTYDITLAVGTYSVKAIDGTDSRGYAEQTGVEVESATPENVIFVAVGATGSNDGTSWDNAFTDLQTAIDTAVSGQEVWVKQGTYYPSVAVGGLGEERDKAFYLKTGVAVYGGFTGADYIFANRDYTANETICHANGNYHVFHFKDKNCGRTAILDGFTVRGANGNNTTDNRHRGGGFAFPTESSHPTIRNCKITANYCYYGGAIRVYNTSSPIFENCLIYDNTADYAITVDYLVGGVAMTDRFTLSKCTIYNTSLKSQRCIQGWDGNCDGIVIDGCTFYNWNNFHVIRLVSSPNHQPNIINRCTFYNNYAALKLDMSTINSHQHQVSNCIIRNNTYGIYGSGYASLYYGCTLTANTYALYNWNDVNKGDFANCIIYGNTNMFARAGYNNFTFTHSDCQTAQSGTGNISINPNWDANYRLNAGSPCVDVGDNTKVYGDYDLDGNPRIVNTTVDMGCYERQ